MGKTDSYDVEGTQAKDVPFWCSCRLWLSLIAFWAFVNLYAQRVGMSVAIVCMLNNTAISEGAGGSNESSLSNVTFIDTCSRGSVNGSDPMEDGPFNWDKEIQGHILGAFFYGYLVSQVPGGLLAERYGGKWVLAGCLFVSTAATLVSPWAARVSYGFLIALRVLVGIGSGAMFPAMHAMWGQWAPPMERSKLAGISYAGAMMGNVLALPVSGLLCKYGFDDGWASVFYVFGLSSVVALVIWVALTANTPASHPRISPGEKEYIVNSLKGQISAEDKHGFCDVPWLEFAKSPAVWAILVANITSDWGLFTLLTNIPTFLKDVLRFDIQSNGFYSALPFLGLWANMNVSPIVADKLRSSGILSTTVVRKLFNSIGHLGAGVFLIGLGFLDCSQTGLAVALLTISVTISGSSYAAFLVNHMDIAPKYAGTLFGITNGIGACSGFIAPYVAAKLTNSPGYDTKREEWQRVFFVAAGVYAFGAIVYMIFASGEIQPWARDKTVEMEEMETMVDKKPIKDDEKPVNGDKPATNGNVGESESEKDALKPAIC